MIECDSLSLCNGIFHELTKVKWDFGKTKSHYTDCYVDFDTVVDYMIELDKRSYRWFTSPILHIIGMKYVSSFKTYRLCFDVLSHRFMFLMNCRNAIFATETVIDSPIDLEDLDQLDIVFEFIDLLNDLSYDKFMMMKLTYGGMFV